MSTPVSTRNEMSESGSAEEQWSKKIGHLKSDFGLDSNFLKGQSGDQHVAGGRHLESEPLVEAGSIVRSFGASHIPEKTGWPLPPTSERGGQDHSKCW